MLGLLVAFEVRFTLSDDVTVVLFAGDLEVLVMSNEILAHGMGLLMVSSASEIRLRHKLPLVRDSPFAPKNTTTKTFGFHLVDIAKLRLFGES